MIANILTIAFILFGLFLLIVSVIGTINYPDFYSRLHVLGLGQTLAFSSFAIGFVIYLGFSILSLKVIILAAALMIAGPIGTHIIDKVAFKEAMEEKEEK